VPKPIGVTSMPVVPRVVVAMIVDVREKYFLILTKMFGEDLLTIFFEG
jgi:ABC-type dipeptide/oligopeptide/nickel transport system permease subunit